MGSHSSPLSLQLRQLQATTQDIQCANSICKWTLQQSLLLAAGRGELVSSHGGGPWPSQHLGTAALEGDPCSSSTRGFAKALPSLGRAQQGSGGSALLQGALRPLRQGQLTDPVRGQGCASHAEPAPPHSQKPEQRPQCPQMQKSFS